jgi:hypothetical protein
MMKQRADEKQLTTADMAAAAADNGPKDEAGKQSAPRPERDEPSPAAPPDGNPNTTSMAEAVALLSIDEANDLRTRWTDVQTGFVDEPRQAVEQADRLVADTMQRLAQSFADERKQLERQWSGGRDVSTEDLRLALRRYRSFFDRLLSVQLS